MGGEVSINASRRPFRIDLAYTDADIMAYQQVLSGRRRFNAQLHAWGVIGTGFAAALIGASIAAGVGIVRVNDGGLIAVLIFVGFYLGVWSPSMWSKLQDRRWKKERLAAFHERWKDAVVLVSSKGDAHRPLRRHLHSGETIGAGAARLDPNVWRQC
jgi:hypothetical protein